MRLSLYQEKIIWLALCAPLFAATHLANAWVFNNLSISNHISWVYLPAFLRVVYVLVLGPIWGFMAIFLGGIALAGSGGPDENLRYMLLNAAASGLGPVLALGLFRLLKERRLQLSRLSDLFQMCLLYALLNAVIHHFTWASQQPELLMSVTQLPIMIVGDLSGALLGALLFTQLMRSLGLYQVMNRLSEDQPRSNP